MLALLAALVLLWALRWPMSRSLGLYFIAELLYIPPVLLTWYFFGAGKVYGWVYGIFTGVALLAVANLACDSIREAKYKARTLAAGFLLAGLFTKMAFVLLQRPIGWFDWLVLVEGGLLFWAGVLIGYSAPHSKVPSIYVGLGFLWVIQAFFDFGYCAHWPHWNRANEYAPPLIGIAGFLFLGWRLRSRFHSKLASHA